GTGPDAVLRPADVVYVPKSDIKVYVGGEVQRPGIVPLEGELTALKAVMLAGGFLDTASPDKAVLIRDRGNNTPEVVELKFGRQLLGESADSLLKPYDIVFVPKSNIAKIDKAVDQYIKRVVPLTMTGGFSYIVGGGGISNGITCFP